MVAENYLIWVRKKVDDGSVRISEYHNKARHLGLFSDMFGRRLVPTLRPDEMTAFGETLLGGYSPVYTRNVCSTARAALNWAVRERHIETNPIKGFKAPTIPRSSAKYAETAEAAAFLGLDLARTRDQPGKIRPSGRLSPTTGCCS